MTTLAQCSIAFVAGAAYEAGCVFWVHNAERGRPWTTGVLAACIGAVELTGLLQAIHGLAPAASLVVGYGVGTGVAVAVKRWWVLRSAT